MLKLLLALVILWSMYVEQRHNFIYFFKFFAPRLCGFDAVLDFFRPLFQMHPEVDR